MTMDLTPDPRTPVERLLALGAEYEISTVNRVGEVMFLVRAAVVDHEERLARLEAIAKADRRHEVSCPIGVYQRSEWGVPQGQCDCWLAEVPT